ncbi:tachylectin-related carbohydrate-binding protein [Nonomuraea sp. CA-143628]|uniref:tachylectin-related carbohydrate-binding protein n=1 Tax=Nonomuraea sp. CA-143628 TaxID=3239997 RepID=UPI003D8BE23E
MLRTHLAVLTTGIVGASLLFTVSPRPAVADSALTCSAVVPVYGINGEGKLRWYGHRAGASGENSWAADSGKEIGYGWNTLTKVFSGGNGVIYAVDGDGGLKWYRHLSPATGERGWAPGEGTVIGRGWGDFVDIVSAGSGVIYALDKAGDLHWYRHLSPMTGEAQWAPGSGKVIRSGWTAITTLMTGRDGTLYGVNTKGHIRWYDHTDPVAGGTAFGTGTGLVAGEGWEDYRSPSGAGAGVVYALDASGRMWWQRHADPLAGAPVWQDRRPLKTGFASFTALFADATACSPGQSFTGYAPGKAGQNLYYSQGRVGALLTEGARTAVTFGEQRKFAEATTEATVSTRAWVRLLPGPWSPSAPWAASWPAANIARTDEDLLEIATQYFVDAPAQVRDGLRYAGDAHYGPLLPDGTREEGSDFNDYLGLSWTYDDKIDPPEARQKESLDCSGFVRMVFGYRGGYPLGIGDTLSKSALPRRAVQMADENAPGVTVTDGGTAKPTSYADLQTGDLLFWDASTDDGTALDHVGMYLGIDSTGKHRFISSRKSVDGPTLGDEGGPSTLDSATLYDRSWRKAKRA